MCIVDAGLKDKSLEKHVLTVGQEYDYSFLLSPELVSWHSSPPRLGDDFCICVS